MANDTPNPDNSTQATVGPANTPGFITRIEQARPEDHPVFGPLIRGVQSLVEHYRAQPGAHGMETGATDDQIQAAQDADRAQAVSPLTNPESPINKPFAKFHEGATRIASDLHNFADTHKGVLSNPAQWMLHGVATAMENVPIGNSAAESAAGLVVPPELPKGIGSIKLNPDAFAEHGGKVVSPVEAKSSGKNFGGVNPTDWSRAHHFESTSEPRQKVDIWHNEPANAPDPIEDLVMSDKVKGKVVRPATPKPVEPAIINPAPEPEAYAAEGGKFVGKSPEASSTGYSVPTEKLQKMPASAGRPEVHTIRHELGHALVGQKEGLIPKGIISDSHPLASSDMRAAVEWDPAGIIDPNTHRIYPGMRVPYVRTLMGGIASDEAFNDLPRSANNNFFLTKGGDGTRAYKILRAAGFDHGGALDEMHKAIDDGKEYLTHPAVSGIIKENENFREPGLSLQYHASSNRLQNMHMETQRRIANEKQNTEVNDNGTASGPIAEGRSGNVTRGKGEVSGAGEGGSSEEGIVSEERIKKTPKLSEPASTALPPQPRLPDTGTYPAIKTDDGGIYFDAHPESRTHVMFAQEQGIPPERVISGGWLRNGDYESSERSDAGRWGEQARAKLAVAAKHSVKKPAK